MKKLNFVALLLTLLIVASVSMAGGLAKPLGTIGSEGQTYINVAFNTATTDTIYWFGPYDVSALWTLGGTGAAQGPYPGNSNDSLSFDMNIYTVGYAAGSDAATYEVSAYMTPIPVRPPKNYLETTAGSGWGGMTLTQLVGGAVLDSNATAMAVTADAVSKYSEIHINRDMATSAISPACGYVLFKVHRLNTTPVTTKALIVVSGLNKTPSTP